MKHVLVFLTAVLIGASACAGAAGGAAGGAGDGVVATINGKPLTDAELEKRLGPRLLQVRQQEYQLKLQAIQEHVVEQVQRAEAAKLGISEEEYFKRSVLDKVAEPAKEQVDQVLAQYRSRLPQDDAQAREEVLRFLRSQAQSQREQAFRAELLAKAELKVLLEPPRAVVPLQADDPSQGPADAPVTIVEFSDFQCPYCVRVMPVLHQLRKDYGDKIRLVFKQLPLDMHQHARFAAEATLCAGDQGKFWPLHDWLFANQSKINPESILAEAPGLGIDAAALKSCLDEKRKAAKVDADLELAASLGPLGTPAFFINGRLLEGAQPLQAFKEIVDDELTRRAAATKAQ